MMSKTTMLRALLNERFFNSCLVHEEDRKNEENSFCMDCGFSLCYHCLPHHQAHRILQIRRYMYNDVLRLKDANKIFDCSFIQTYTTNSEKVVLLRQRQRVTFTNRGSRCICVVCNQIIKPSFVYCSIVCKFSNQKVYPHSSKDLGRNFLVSGSVGGASVSMESSLEENSSIATAGDVTNYESMPVAKEVDRPEQNRSTAISSNGSTRKLHGRKGIAQRSPFF